MIFIKETQIFRLFFFINKIRKRQLFILTFLLILNGFLESFSIATLIPFLSIISSQNPYEKYPYLETIFKNIGIEDLNLFFLSITILFSIFISLSTFLKIFNMRYIQRFSAKLDNDLSNLILRNNIYQPYIDYTKKNSSFVITTLVDKVQNASIAICSLLNMTASSILGIFIIGTLLLINWKVVIFGILFLIFLYLLIYKKVRKILNINGNNLSNLIPLRLKILQEIFFGFRDLKINENEQVYIDLFDKYDLKIKLSRASTNSLQYFPRYLTEGIFILVFALIGYNFTLQNLNLLNFLPLFGSYIFVFQRLLPQFQHIYSAWSLYKYLNSSINDVVEELENNFQIKRKYKLKSKLQFKNNICFENINFSYRESEYILKDLNINLYKGEHIGIYGNTGSGKSTFLDLLMGLIRPTSGKVLVDNTNIFEDGFECNWTSQFSHVSQNIFLKEGTIAENIAFGESLENINYDLLVEAARTAFIYDFIKDSQSGFSTLVGERGIRLSGGQRQRIAIARALYRSKDTIILDEATSALDEKTERNIIDAIKSYKKYTIIMVSHRLKTLKICDRVFKVINKKIIEEKY